MTNSLLISIIIYLAFYIDASSALCSTFGVCHETPAYFNYCPADEETSVPRPLPESSRHLEEQLRLKCPYLFADGNRDLCCDPAQVDALFKMISIATSLFSRCPSCMDNFWKYWCMYTCSPNQKDYLEVLDTESSPSTNRTMVIKVRYNLSREYAENTYSSCKDVKLASASGNAMLMMCGRLGYNETCTLERWLNFMGTRSHALGIPVDILHNYHERKNAAGKKNYMDMETSRCDQSPRAGQSKCMPADCPRENGRNNEFVLEETAVQEPCKLFGLGCSVYFLVFSVVIFVGVLAWAFLPHLMQRTDLWEKAPTEISTQAHWIPHQIHVNSVLFVEFVSKQPCLTILSGIFVAIICSTGLLFMVVTSSPLEVWVPPNSRAIQEKEYFDSHFGPFYRVQQVIMYPKPGKFAPVSAEIGPVFQKSFMKEVFKLVNSLLQLNASLSDGRKVSLGDICYRPMGSEYDCLVNSPTNYFGHNGALLDVELFEATAQKSQKDEEFSYDYDEKEAEKPRKITYLDHIMECIGNPFTTNSSFGRSCLGPYGGPTFTSLVFGNENHDRDALNSTAVIISIPLSSKADLLKMRAWEKSFIKFLKKYKNDEVQLSFMAERSIQDEIKRSSETDATTVFIALLLMILYSIFALGKYKVIGNRLTSILIHSKITVGICGILSIFTAIASSLGIFSFYGLPIPSAAIVMNSFVTLLIGCNRIFAAVWTARKTKNIEDIGTAFRTSLPSSFTCTLVQSAIFFTGALISVPAVRSFCLLSSLSIILQLFFLCVLFLPILIIDLRREKDNRPEFLCLKSCIPAISEEETEKINVSEAKTTNPAFQWVPQRLSLQLVTLLIPAVVLFVFPWACAEIKLGLDQKLAVPTDSYMFTHFKNIEKYLNVGPPVYFVVQGDVDFSRPDWQNKFCSLGGCEDNSVGGILSQAAVNPEKSYLTGETLNWLDNYLEWLTPESRCCRLATSSVSSLSQKNIYCHSSDENCSNCDTFNANGRPTEAIFYRHLNRFLDDVPSAHCVKGGRAAFHEALHLDPSGHVDSSHFMAFHVALRNSSAYIEAMNSARFIAQRIEEELGGGVTVFPYSVFYVFYEQFSTIRTVSAYQLIFAFTAIFLGVFILTGFDALLAFIMLFVCSFQLISQILFMALWNIDLNSISAVNLVLAVAICVEYCLPVLAAFGASSKKSSHLKAEEAARAVVPSSLCGLTIPMTLGTTMLTFTQSPFFNVYFFRMLIVTAWSCSFSGLLLLPVLLSLSGLFERRANGFRTISSPTMLQDDENSTELRSRGSPPNLPLLTTVL